MFKKVSLLIALSLTALATSAYALEYSGREAPPSDTIPFVSYYEKTDLPPHLIAVFHVDCSEQFLGVVRHDQYDPQSQSVIISLGAQVRHLVTDCQGSLRKVEIDAGPVYSGRPYQIRQIAPDQQSQR
jgi:hypothetical protein